MGELQRAHLQQNRVVRELEEAVARVPVLKKTVRNQQQVIVSLEALLRRAVAEVKELKAANTAAATALGAAAASRDAAEAAKSSAEISAARARAKAESAMSHALRAGKSKAKAARVKEPEPQAAAATPSLHSLPAPVPPQGTADATPPAATVQSLPLPAQAPVNLPPEPVELRSPQHTPDEVVALRKELSRVKERMDGLQQTAEEARQKEQQAVATAEAAQAASEAAGERAKQAEEAAQAADNDLLEVSSNWLSWCIGTHMQCPGEVRKDLSRKCLLIVLRAVGC